LSAFHLTSTAQVSSSQSLPQQFPDYMLKDFATIRGTVHSLQNGISSILYKYNGDWQESCTVQASKVLYTGGGGDKNRRVEYNPRFKHSDFFQEIINTTLTYDYHGHTDTKSVKHKWTHLSVTNNLHAKHLQNTRKYFKHRYNSIVLGLLSSVIVYFILTDQDIPYPAASNPVQIFTPSISCICSNMRLSPRHDFQAICEPLQPTLHTPCSRLRHALSASQSHISIE
jgi:hypothetical protein